MLWVSGSPVIVAGGEPSDGVIVMVGDPSSRAASPNGPAPAGAAFAGGHSGPAREEIHAGGTAGGAHAGVGGTAAEASRFQVFDGDGRFVGVFASWEAAHAWSHWRAAEPVTRLPVRIEDHLDRRTWTVEPGLCQLTVWRRHSEFRVCPPPGAPAPDPARPGTAGAGPHSSPDGSPPGPAFSLGPAFSSGSAFSPGPAASLGSAVMPGTAIALDPAILSDPAFPLGAAFFPAAAAAMAASGAGRRVGTGATSLVSPSVPPPVGQASWPAQAAAASALRGVAEGAAR
ncbi:hypothetical protein MXD62_02600 [Frankia sp. Mgl5]|uniref:hypothetical protein n=1 Tax=Frankia sp. Mgl5 TaxID=2933793 RepID=UPI00200CD96A|nr:hypothetical protein [Frankia sp. Mgl5]MCK9926064.1 hypothetical protein [Frankia sp. Mgl5]